MLSFGDLLKNAGDSKLSEVRRHASMLRQLQISIDQHLPPALAEYCRVVNLRESTLVLSAGTPALAAKIRHSSARILHAVRALGKIERIQVKVIAAEPDVQSGKKRRRISAKALESIESAATSIRDPELAAQFRRLADRHRERG